MPITNSSYSQQINDAFNVLKYAPADKLQALATQVQANPQSPEAMALAMATQFQAEMRQPSAQAPQQTVMQQKLAQLQGLPAVGANQMAFNQAAEQDPMQNAGIAAAPEAAPEEAPQEPAPEAAPEEAPQEAAVGGIVSLAHGGHVRGFAKGETVDAAPHLIPSSWVDAFESMMSPSPGRPRDVVEKERLEEEAKAVKEPPSDIETALKSFLSPSPGKPRNAPEGTGKGAKKDEDYSDIMRGEAGETFAGAGLGALKQASKQEPTTGASVTPRAEPTTGAKEAGYSTPEEQAIETINQSTSAVPASEQASSLMPGESYGIPSVGGIGDYAKMLDKERGLSDARMSEAQEKRLQDLTSSAEKDKWMDTLAAMIFGTLSAETPYLSQALGAGGVQALSAYQQGAREESDIARKAFDIYGEEEKARQLEHAHNVDEVLKLMSKKAEMEHAERIAANKGGLSFEERVALKGMNTPNPNKDIATQMQIEQTIQNQTDMYLKQGLEAQAARKKAEEEFYARYPHLRPLGGIGSGGFGDGSGFGGITVTRQGVRQ
jgi:hypothetical protein